MRTNIPEQKLASVVINGIEQPFEAERDYAEGEVILTDKLNIVHSCELKEDKKTDYRTALMIGKTGVVPESSVSGAVKGGFNDTEADGISVEAHSPAFSAVIVQEGSYCLKNAKIDLLTDGDGLDSCDFVGYGSAVCAFKGAKVTLENCDIRTEGVAKCALFVDDGSDAVVKNSRFHVMGGKLYEGYVNSADFNYMVAPPWVLGIMGSARGMNLMGNKASTVLVNTDIIAGNWGAISTDNGEDNRLAVIDSTLTVVGSEKDKKDPYLKKYGSGYGSYILGCDEDFRGVTMNVGTYIGIAREGNAVYRSSKGPVRVVSPTTGEVLYEGEGKGRVSELNSEVFGIMAHDKAELTLTDGTVMNTGAAAFLMRCGGVTIRVEDGAKVSAADGVILQIIDDDDMTVGVDWNAPKEIQFRTDFYEKEGWPSENGQITSMMPPPDPSDMPPPPPEDEEPRRSDVNFIASDTVLNGDLYNGSGYYGQPAKQLFVTLGSRAVLNGSVSATETIHVDENGKQNTHFTIDEYYYLGHMANRPFFNGDNTAEVRLEAGAQWNVTKPGKLTALTVMDGARLNGSVTVNGESVLPESGKTYTGDIVVSPAK